MGLFTTSVKQTNVRNYPNVTLPWIGIFLYFPEQGPNDELHALFTMIISLQWRHIERDGVSNHPSLDCLLNRLFRCTSKKTSRLRITGLCEGNSPVTGEFPAQRASSAEKFPFHDVIMVTFFSVIFLSCCLCRTRCHGEWELDDITASIVAPEFFNVVLGWENFIRAPPLELGSKVFSARYS